MAQTRDKTIAVLTELKCRIEYLRNGTDEQTLINSIENTLMQHFSFQYGFNLHSKTFAYNIKTCIDMPSFMISRSPNKLIALYSTLCDLLNEYKNNRNLHDITTN